MLMKATTTECRCTYIVLALASIIAGILALLLNGDAFAASDQFPGIAEKNYLLVAAVFEDKILRFDGATGQYIDDFVTPKSGGLDEPSGMAVGSDGNLYVASAQTNQIFRYD